MKYLPGISGVLPDVKIGSIVADSRQVQPGSLFVACRGGTVDGHCFIPDAIKRGAVAIVGEKKLDDLPVSQTIVPYVKVVDSHRALAKLAAAFHDYPARKLTVIGVTGTDGKTTTTSLIYQILLSAGHCAGMISTVNAIIGDRVLDTGFHVTTPDAPDVQNYLAKMVEAGITHVVLETTSHGLAQHRVDCCEFDLAVVTNITHEHLDYHGTYENYRSAKARLFEMLAETLEKPQGNPRLGVINKDDSSYSFLSDLTAKLPGVHSLAYGLQPGGAVWAEEIYQDRQGSRFIASSQEFAIPLHSPLVGYYNISNILAAVLATKRGLGIPDRDVIAGVAALPGIPGRMEQIDFGQKFLTIVDFAHTPNALKRTLETARQLSPNGRVIAIFGSAGLRDRQKRRMMAEISTQLADLTILTAEDPRTESLNEILEEMAEGAQSQGGKEGSTFWCIPDRREAIRYAIKMACPGDIVIACGKGHEQSMCFDATEYPWDDRIAVRAALAELLGLPGPKMPHLPAT